jgi:hypothetical protein
MTGDDPPDVQPHLKKGPSYIIFYYFKVKNVVTVLNVRGV